MKSLTTLDGKVDAFAVAAAFAVRNPAHESSARAAIEARDRQAVNDLQRAFLRARCAAPGVDRRADARAPHRSHLASDRGGRSCHAPAPESTCH